MRVAEGLNPRPHFRLEMQASARDNRWVSNAASALSTDSSASIHFLGIGAQKAGTTWLWSMLRSHPQIWMPPQKELHYFDRATTYPSPSFLASSSLATRLFGRESHHREFRRKARNALAAAFAAGDWECLRWNARYFLGTCGDAWYLSLFPAATGAVHGEITPAYSILDDRDVARVRALLPAVKIIFLLRNPVERAWSQVRFEWSRGRLTELADLEKVRAFVDAPAQTLRSDYLRTLDLWEAHFPKGQIFIGFYDDIREKPAELLAQLLVFLEVDPAAAPPQEQLQRKVHRSRAAPIPEPIRRHLAAKYLPDIERLSVRVGGPAQRWQRELEMIV